MACVILLLTVAYGQRTKLRELSPTQQTFVLMKTSWRHLEVVFRLRLQKTSSDVLIKTNMLVFALRLLKTSSSRRVGQDQYIRLGHASSRRLQDDFKTSLRCLAKTYSRRFEDVFKTSARLLEKRLQHIFKTSSRCFEDVFKTSCKDIFKTFSRRIIKLNCSC